MSAEHADGVRLAHVEVDSPGGRSVVTLSFYGDLTPVEATAAFLRDLADVVVTGSGVLLDVAEQLDPSSPVEIDWANVRVNGPDPTRAERRGRPYCGRRNPQPPHFDCTRPSGHDEAHIAGTGRLVAAIWSDSPTGGAR